MMKLEHALILFKKVCKHGILLTYAGVLTLVFGFAFGMTNSNILLAVSITAVILGAILHVYSIKKESMY